MVLAFWPTITYEFCMRFWPTLLVRLTHSTASELLVYTAAVMKKFNLHAIRSATKIIQMRRDIKHNSTNI